MFKSSTKELSGKIDWIMQILNEINVKINDNSSRIMKLEAELRGIHLDEIGENIKAINEGLYKVKEAMNEAGKMREIISAFKNLNVKGEFKENTDELKKSIEEVMQQLLQIKSEVYSNIKALTDKINSIQTIHQEIMKNIMSVKDLEVNALKNISTITIMQKEIGETEENIRKLLEHYKEIIDKTASTKIELNKLMNEIERRDEESKRRLEEVTIYEEKIKKKEEELIEREKLLTQLINALIEKIKEYEEIMKLTNSRITYLKILEEKGREIEGKIKELKEEKERLEKEVSILIRRRDNLEEEICKLNDMKTCMEKNLKSIMVTMKVEQPRTNI